MRKLLAFLVLVFVGGAHPAFADQYVVDASHSEIAFSIPHLMVFKVRGSFTKFSGVLEFDEETEMIRSAKGKVAVASIFTRERRRDKHLRSPDFFDSPRFPEITFTSTEVKGNSEDIVMYGNLTIKGVTKQIKLRGHYLGTNKGPQGLKRIGFEARGTINRKDFGLQWDKVLEANGGVVVDDYLQILLDIQAVRE